MRNAFVGALIQYSRINSNIHLLTADLGFEVLESYIEENPKKFTNVGVAEANMISVAAGMSSLGLTVVCYSIVPFLIYKTFEQIRNDVCYPNLNVKLVGVGAGFNYSVNGPSHHGLEDLALIQTLPNIKILSPADPNEAYLATEEMLKNPGPYYLRLGKKGETIINHQIFKNLNLKNIQLINKGEKIVIFTTGSILETVQRVILSLKKQNLNPTLVHIPTLKPLAVEEIINLINQHQKIVTIEEHSVYGGLGSLIASLDTTNLKIPKPQLMIGVEDKFYNTGGSSKFLREKAGLDHETITNRILKWR